MALKLRTLDLHTHSPASHDFIGEATAEQIVEHAISVGLDGIAITDHNTVDFISNIQNAAEGTVLTVFPGVEISCGGSREGSIHVIGLFEPGTAQKELDHILGRLEVKGHGDEALTNKSVNDVIDIIAEGGGLAVLPHANSTHGALNDIRGNPRTNIVKNPNLSAVEATQGDFAKEEGSRLLDYLNGKDRTYQRKLAVYSSSDNPAQGGHCLQTIGSVRTGFRMGEMSLEALRQCFEDPDARIVQYRDLQNAPKNHPRLLSLGISGGFLDGLQIDFHEGMNSIIGGTGTGKSLVIEIIRFALNKKPHSKNLFNDHREKLLKRFTSNGKVNLRIRDSSGDCYEIERTIADTKQPYSDDGNCRNVSTGEEFSGDIGSIFPTLIYSQNEIVEITRDDSAQLALLDTFRDFSKDKAQQNEYVATLKDLDSDIIKERRKVVGIVEKEKSLSTTKEKLKKVEKLLKPTQGSDKGEKYLELREKDEAAKTELEQFTEISTQLDEFTEELRVAADDYAHADSGEEEEPLKSISSAIVKTYEKLEKGLVGLLGEIKRARKNADTQLSSWRKSVEIDKLAKKHTDEVKKVSVIEGKENERANLVKEKTRIEKAISDGKAAQRKIENLRRKRDQILDKLDELLDGSFAARTEQATTITQGSEGRLKITVSRGSNHGKYVEEFVDLKVGSRAERTKIENLANKVSPRSLSEIVLDEDFKRLASEGGISQQLAKSILAELTKPDRIERALGLCYEAVPEDVVDIRYQKIDGNHYPLSELSMGQKADALMMIALGDGAAPAIIDQPEDALDLPSIWRDVCSQIRPSKHMRQFIFTTHNSSISVASDSDQFTVLEADGVKGWVSRSGSIDESPVKDMVVEHLEGGRESYDLKRRKYGL